MKLPNVLSEHETLARVLGGQSISRFGDGELRLAVGRACTSQRKEKGIASELRRILADPGPCLVAIPNFAKTPRQAGWKPYTEHRFMGLYTAPEYGSSFITRPDNAPWIDESGYWNDLRKLWRDQEVLLVAGDMRSLREDEMAEDGAKVETMWGPRQHAYIQIDEIEEAIGRPSKRVLLCLGACATVLAWRLARKGVHAVDIGHAGMFLRHAGAYAFKPEQLASEGHRNMCRKGHAESCWPPVGGVAPKRVARFAEGLAAKSILDYGSGSGWLKRDLDGTLRVFEYDVGVPGRETLPKPAEVVACIDVLPMVERETQENVIEHVFRLAGRGVFWVVPDDWVRRIKRDGWTVTSETEAPYKRAIVTMERR